MLYFGFEIAVEIRCRNDVPLNLHIMGESFGNRLGIKDARLMSLPEIEEVSTFAALIEGT